MRACTSLQVRGSIPLFWHQEGGGSRLKPDILLQQYDPLYSATRTHIDDLRSRYGASSTLPAGLISCGRPGTLWLVAPRPASLLFGVCGVKPGVSTDIRRANCAGNPVVCLNLVKASEKRPRETLLRTEFQNAIQYLNQRVRAASDPVQVATWHHGDLTWYAVCRVGVLAQQRRRGIASHPSCRLRGQHALPREAS